MEEIDAKLFKAAKTVKNANGIEKFIILGANVNAKDEYERTVLHVAAECNKNPKVITILIKIVANVNAVDYCGQTALHCAAACNENPEIITEFTKKIFKTVDIDSQTIPRYKFIKVNVDVNVKDSRGKTALHYAIELNQNSKVAITLIQDKKLDVNVKDNDGETALHKAMTKYSEEQKVKVIDALINARANVNAKNKEEETVLEYAIKFTQSIEVFDMLINAGAKVDDKTIDLANNNRYLNQDIINSLKQAKKRQKQ